MESCIQIGRRPVEREHVAAGKPYFRLTNYTQHDHSQLLKSRVPRWYGSKVSWKVGISRLLGYLSWNTTNQNNAHGILCPFICV